MTEAARASVRHGFAELSLRRIIGQVMPEYIAGASAGKPGLRYAEAVSFGASNSNYIVDA